MTLVGRVLSQKILSHIHFHFKPICVLLQVCDSENTVQKDDCKEIPFSFVQNICVVINHDEHEVCKHSSEQLALLSTQHWKHWCHLVFVVSPKYSSCNRTFVVFFLWNFWAGIRSSYIVFYFFPYSRFSFLNSSVSDAHKFTSELVCQEVLPLLENRLAGSSFGCYSLQVSHLFSCWWNKTMSYLPFNQYSIFIDFSHKKNCNEFLN